MFATVLPLMMAALLFTVFTVTVQADAPLVQPISMRPPTAPSDALVSHPVLRHEAAALDNNLRGIASWYGAHFHGRTTASGEPYDMFAMTACDNTLPFGSIVRVVNLINHRSVVVRINDHGSLFPGRVIDLSYAAARQLEIIHEGLAPVRLEVLSRGK